MYVRRHAFSRCRTLLARKGGRPRSPSHSHTAYRPGILQCSAYIDEPTLSTSKLMIHKSKGWREDKVSAGTFESNQLFRRKAKPTISCAMRNGPTLHCANQLGDWRLFFFALSMTSSRTLSIELLVNKSIEIVSQDTINGTHREEFTHDPRSGLCSMEVSSTGARSCSKKRTVLVKYGTPVVVMDRSFSTAHCDFVLDALYRRSTKSDPFSSYRK